VKGVRAALLTAVFGFSSLVLAQSATRSIQFGFEQRVRNEDWNNICDYSDRTDDQRNQIRFRTRFSASVPVNSNISLAAGLDTETNKKMGQDLVADEIMFESLYVDVKRLFTPRLSLRVGRQDISRGEGFIFGDATPWDGSRSSYVNGADLTLHAFGSSLEFMAISDPSRDRYLPRINDQHRLLIEWNEAAAGMYWTKPVSEHMQAEGYYFYKTETNDYRSTTDPHRQPDKRFHTWGGRLSGRFASHWIYASEWNWQAGRQGANDVRAFGGYATLKRGFDVRTRPYVLAGYTAMSGDDPRTATVESWDPLFARGAKWGDLLLYSMFPEKGPAYLTNAKLAQAEAGFSPFKKLALRTTYYHLGAFHPNGGDWRFGSGTHRGELFQIRGDLTVNKHWRGHVDWESIYSGNFYTEKPKAYFLRFEVIFQFNGRIAI
jgi:hypothetical protein